MAEPREPLFGHPKLFVHLPGLQTPIQFKFCSSDFEARVREGAADIVPMYFTEPERILNTFMEIEENNLFLIQNCQETEEALEELKSKFNEAKQKMDEEAANLKVQIEQIRQKIAASIGKIYTHTPLL